MLRLWRDRYCVALRPDGVELVRRRHGPQTAIDLKEAAACAPAAEGPAWGPPLIALKELLARPRIGAGDLSVVLSNHFARFLIVPWNGELANAVELQNYALACYENVFGEAAAAWEVRVSPERAEAPRIACAFDRTLLEGLNEAVAGSKLRLASVQPYLMVAYNRVSKAFRSKDFVFLLAEEGRACLLAASGSLWRSVRSTPLPIADPLAMAGFIEREVHLADLDEEHVPAIYIHAPQRSAVVVPSVRGVQPNLVQLKPVTGFSPLTDGQFAMAATAA